MNKTSLLSRQQYVVSMLDKVNILLPRNKIDLIANVVFGGNLITEIRLGVSVYDFYVRHGEVVNHHQLEADALSGERWPRPMLLSREQKIAG
ncbi:MAG: hypothetical protein P4L95_08455 [Rouxiella aceris]|uniref:hypothetical protein n=1 Tax=Rouxiella aceris TaxID=2703884 RepID=UPI002849FEA7|nr:hypothetical protein [Rouxiella aceris]MDR3431913.1 hypothetical protein [Rouxiella aceris]